jgi:hypothetical protein
VVENGCCNEPIPRSKRLKSNRSASSGRGADSALHPHTILMLNHGSWSLGCHGSSETDVLSISLPRSDAKTQALAHGSPTILEELSRVRVRA